MIPIYAQGDSSNPNRTVVEDALNNMHEQALSLASRNNTPELECLRLTGMDKHKCDSFSSCQYACYSVTSYCYPIALGSGREFINGLWSYANMSRHLNTTLQNEAIAYEALKGNFSLQNLTYYSSAVSEVNRAASTMLKSVLVNWICEEPNFDMVSFSSAEHELEQAQNTFLDYKSLTILPSDENETQNDTLETCAATVMHQIFSDLNYSDTKVTIATKDCDLQAFVFTDEIPPKFSQNMEEIGWSIEPNRIDGSIAVWDFNGLENGQTITMEYTVPRWVGFSKVEGFGNTTITLKGTEIGAQENELNVTSIEIYKKANNTELEEINTSAKEQMSLKGQYLPQEPKLSAVGRNNMGVIIIGAMAVVTLIGMAYCWVASRGKKTDKPREKIRRGD